MGLLIGIERDGQDLIEQWCAATDLFESTDFTSWEAECARRKQLLCEEYGFTINEYDHVVPDKTLPRYRTLTALVESGLIPGLEEQVEIAIREIPTPQPGEMYSTSDGVVPFREASLSKRLEDARCAHCRSDGFMGGYYFEVLDDDGTLSKCRGCYYGFFGDEDRGVEPELPDDFGLVLSWNEKGFPSSYSGCRGFEWD